MEPACGAALAAVLTPRWRIGSLAEVKSVVVVVCGGSAVSIEMLAGWKQKFAL